MPKAYLIARIRAHDFKKMEEFGALARPAIAKYGGTILVFNSSPLIKEGSDNGIAVVIEFKDMETANQFYHSDDYTAAKAIRLLAAETDMIIAEGL